MKSSPSLVVSATKNKPVFPFTHFLRAYAALGITMIEAMVVLQHTTYWWTNPKLPFPGDQTIAARMGVDRATVVRAKKRLVKRGFLRIISRFEKGRRTTSKYDYTALVPMVEAKYAQLVEEEKARRSREYQYTEYDAQTGELLIPDEAIEAMAVGYPMVDAISDTLIGVPVCDSSATLYGTPESHTAVTPESHTAVTPVQHRKLSKQEEVLERDQNRSSLSLDMVSEAFGSLNHANPVPGFKRGREQEDRGEISENPVFPLEPGNLQAPTLDHNGSPKSPVSPLKALEQGYAKSQHGHTKRLAKQQAKATKLEAVQGDEHLTEKEKEKRTASVLYRTWQGALRKKFPGIVLPEDPKKEIGLIMGLVKRWGPMKTSQLLTSSVEHWHRFMKWRSWLPPEPTLGILTKEDSTFVSVLTKVARFEELSAMQDKDEVAFNRGTLDPTGDAMMSVGEELEALKVEFTRIGFLGGKKKSR